MADASNPYQPALPVHCAGCTRVRGDVNGWFVIDMEVSFICAPLDPTVKLSPKQLPACGQQCAIKIFQAYLDRSK